MIRDCGINSVRSIKSRTHVTINDEEIVLNKLQFMVWLCSGIPLTFHEHHGIAESQRTAAALGNAHSLVLGEQNYSPM